MKYLLFITDKNINIDRFFTARIETKLEMQLRKFKLLHFFNAYMLDMLFQCYTCRKKTVAKVYSFLSHTNVESVELYNSFCENMLYLFY